MKDRLKTLDGLRGICALIVAVSHGLKFIDINHIKNIEDITILHIQGTEAVITKMLLSLFNATGAVYIFFILSGYILALSLSRDTLTINRSFAFYVKRFFRLVPVYFFSIVVTLIILRTLPPHNFKNVSTYFATFYNFTLNISTFLSNVLLLQTNFNPISWTLQVEVIGSSLLPIFYYIFKRISVVKNIIFFLFLFALGIFFRGTNPLHYIYIFYFGLLLLKSKIIFNFLQKNTHIYISTIACTLLLFSLPRGVLLPSSSAMSQLLEVVASWLIVGLVVYSNKSYLQSLLSLKIIQFYGRISYSFYLLNFILLFSLAIFVNRIIPISLQVHDSLLLNLITAVISIIATTILATISYSLIEYPTIMLSLKLVHSQKIRSILNREW